VPSRTTCGANAGSANAREIDERSTRNAVANACAGCGPPT
jgi:hypothetical protein